MEDETTMAKGADQNRFRFENSLQSELQALLRRLVGEGPASFYRDACRHMTTEPPIESVTHQVGHLVREIDAALLGMLGSVTSGGEPNNTYTLEGERRQGAIEDTMEAFGIPEEMSANKTQRLVNALTQGSRSRRIDSVLDALDLPKDDRMARYWKSPPRAASSWTHRNQLLPPRPLDEEFREFWEQAQNFWLAVGEGQRDVRSPGSAPA